MVKTMPIRMIGAAAVVAAFALLAACAPSLPPEQAVQPIPPGPTPEELADYTIAQMQYRYGLITGNGDVVGEANETFRQIPREIFSRQDPRLFAAELVCERYQVDGPAARDRSAPAPFEPQCQNIEWRYDAATNAIRQDVEAQIIAANFSIIAQASPAHP